MGLESFGENLPMPIWYGHIPRVGSDSIPQRLDIVDLLVDGEIVKARGGKRNLVRHVRQTILGKA